MNETRAFTLCAIAALLMAGCDSGMECGPGTHAEGGRCVEACSPGARWDAEILECVSICAEGTIFNEDRGTCEPEVRCGPGTHRAGNECVPDSHVECGSGTRLDPDTGLCVPDCVEGTHRDEATGACMPDSAQCITGQVWDAEAEQCVDVSGYCGEGTTWVASMGACVPDDDLLIADQVEGEGENDPSYGGADSAERLDLPDVGTSVVIGGTISHAVDKDDDGLLDPDYDYFVFTVSGPTLLRIEADGVGGASSGFMITSMDEERSFQRYGIGTTSDGALRDVFLPNAGDFALVASDAFNFVTVPPGPYFGGEGLGYFITVERISIPEAVELLPTDDRHEVEGLWPSEVPAEGSMLGFYFAEVEVDEESVGTLLSLSLETDDRAVGPVLIMVDEEDELLLQGLNASSLWGFTESIGVTIVADYVYWFGSSDASHRVTVADLGMASFDDELSLARIDQASWSEGDEDYPVSYFGFRAEAGKVVTLNATTSTGVTLFEVYEPTFNTSYGWFQGRDTSPLFESTIRFYSHRSGLYVLRVLGLAGATWETSSVRLIPRQRFNISVDAERQVPMPIGRVDDTWITDAPEEVTFSARERFFEIEFDEGDTYSFEVLSGSDFRPVATFYDIEPEGPLASVAYLGGVFPRRFPEAGRALFGIADAAMSPGSFDLQIAPIEIENLGTLTVAAPIDAVEMTLPEGLESRFYRFQASTSGRAQLSIESLGESELTVMVRDASFRLGSTVEGDAQARLIVSDSEPAFFEVSTAGGAAVDGDETFELTLLLTSFSTEVETNDTPDVAQDIVSGEVIHGELTSDEDQDWYAFSVVGGAVYLDVETVAVSGFVDTRLSIVADDGVTVLAFDEDSGDGLLSYIGLPLLEDGTYYIVVHAREGSRGGPYLLEISSSPS